MTLRLRRAPIRPLPQALAALAAGRAGLGVVMLLRPGWLPAALGAPQTGSAGTGWVVQMLGGREIALGLGALVAARRDDRRAERLWLAAGLLSDAVALGRAAGAGAVRQSPGLAVVAVAAVAAALQAAGLAARR